MRPLMRRIALAASLAAAVPAGLGAQVSVKAADLVGTWQTMTAKNLKTGKVDSLAKHRVQWIVFTPTHRLMISSENGRKILKPSELASMTAEQREEAHYNQIWGADGEQLFAANGGAYRLDGNVINYTFAMALGTDPGTTAKYTITSLDRSTLVYRTEPNAQGEVNELTLRKVN
jgi:hypothetical protein